MRVIGLENWLFGQYRTHEPPIEVPTARYPYCCYEHAEVHLRVKLSAYGSVDGQLLPVTHRDRVGLR